MKVLGIEDSEEKVEKTPTKLHAFTETVDINESRHRYYLMKPTTIKEIEEEFKVTIAVKGKYYPDRKLAAKDGELPLFIEVSSNDVKAISEAVKKINSLKENGPPKGSSGTETASSSSELKPSLQVAAGLAAKVFAPFDVDAAQLAGINVRQKILGPQV